MILPVDNDDWLNKGVASNICVSGKVYHHCLQQHIVVIAPLDCCVVLLGDGISELG